MAILIRKIIRPRNPKIIVFHHHRQSLRTIKNQTYICLQGKETFPVLFRSSKQRKNPVFYSTSNSSTCDCSNGLKLLSAIKINDLLPSGNVGPNVTPSMLSI